MSKEIVDAEQFDWKTTLFANVPLALFGLLVTFFIVGIMKAVEEITGAYPKLMALIFLAFIAMKLVFWLGNPVIVFKTKTGSIRVYY